MLASLLRSADTSETVRRLTTATVVALVALVVVTPACGNSPPLSVREDPLPSRNGEIAIYSPPEQGPDANESASIEAMECFVAAHEAGEPAQLEFVQVGIEGQEQLAWLRTLEDGTVDLYQKTGFGWQAFRSCKIFAFSQPGVAEVDDCA